MAPAPPSAGSAPTHRCVPSAPSGRSSASPPPGTPGSPPRSPPLPPPVLALLLALLLAGCASAPTEEPPPDPCASPGAPSTCVSPGADTDYYVTWSSGYFDTMDTAADRDVVPPYSELVARWEWPPWLKLTGYTREGIVRTDTLLRFYPSTIPERDCRFFPVQPFGRCRVVFYYEDEAHEGRGCPIYEEFTFSDAGEITWIEAWSDDAALGWGEADEGRRLSTRIPGLGDPGGRIDLDGEAMAAAIAADPDVADFVTRARDFGPTWLAEYNAAGDDLWERGCGW